MLTNLPAVFQALLEKHYSQLYALHLEHQTITEYALPALTALDAIPFQQWVHEIVSQLPFIQVQPFIRQTQPKRLVEALAENPVYMVEYQSKQGEDTRFQQLVFCYTDESRASILITRQDITVHREARFRHVMELEKDSARFRFIISHLCENFGEVHVRTGKTWMTTCNDWEVTQGNLKDQIDWFAENLIVPEQKEAYEKDFQLDNLVETLRKNNGFYAPTYEANYPDGKRYLLIINALLDNLENPEEEYIFSFVQDITQLKTQEARNQHLLDISQELLTLSQIEPLTKLYNRIAGDKQIRSYLQTKSKHALAVLLIVDIDYFKKFNDQYGHLMGDAVLKYLAASMQGTFRASDILCRWGGDEFVIFMPDVPDLAMVEDRVEALQKKMANHQRNHTPLPISLSIGGALFKKVAPLERLYEEADQYLYQVKSNGRDGFQITVID